MPAKRLALSNNIMPPPPESRAYRLLIILSSKFHGPAPLVMTERARSENGELRRKLPQTAFSPPNELEEDILLPMEVRHKARDEAFRFLQNAPYNLTDANLLITVADYIDHVALPTDALEYKDFNKVCYIPVHAKICTRTPHLEEMGELQKFQSVADLLSSSQSYRKTCYEKAFAFFKLASGNIMPLPEPLKPAPRH